MDSKDLNPTNARWKGLMLSWLKLILNSDQGVVLSRQKQILTGLSTSHKNLNKQNNEDFFIQLFYAWLHLTNNNIPAPISIEEILDQPIFLNPYTKLNFKRFIQDFFRQRYHY